MNLDLPSYQISSEQSVSCGPSSAQYVGLASMSWHGPAVLPLTQSLPDWLLSPSCHSWHLSRLPSGVLSRAGRYNRDWPVTSPDRPNWLTESSHSLPVSQSHSLDGSHVTLTQLCTVWERQAPVITLRSRIKQYKIQGWQQIIFYITYRTFVLFR